jgi:hypothetical protein
MNRVTRTFVLLLAAVWPPVASAQIDIQWIEGRWEKDFLIDKGVRNQDPRWEVALQFAPGAKVSYVSKGTAEVWLTDGTARPMVTEVAIAGRWSVNAEGQVVIELDRAPA